MVKDILGINHKKMPVITAEILSHKNKELEEKNLSAMNKTPIIHHDQCVISVKNSITTPYFMVGMHHRHA